MTHLDDRQWDSTLQRWVWPGDLESALNQAQLAIDEYHNGNRQWAERWLLKAYEANQRKSDDGK